MTFLRSLEGVRNQSLELALFLTLFIFALQGGNDMRGFKSRKFLISVAAMLASIGASIAGISNCNDVVATAGIVCTIIAAAIYAGCEAYVDASHAFDKEDE